VPEGAPLFILAVLFKPEKLSIKQFVISVSKSIYLLQINFVDITFY